MNVALVYDRVNKWGGAERVLLELHRLFPDAPLYTSVYNKQHAPWAQVFSVRPSFLQRFPIITRAHEYLPLMMPITFEQFSFDTYDVVISVTSEAAKGIITKPQTTHICYMLTPTRYLWSGYEEYFARPFMKTLAKPAVSYLRSWDLVASSRPDYVVSISKEVQQRVKKYYGRDSEVIYPPTPRFTQVKNFERSTPYFLVVSRLVPYKHVEIAVQACSNLNLPLVVVGTGSQEQYLRSQAGPSIQFVGSLTDDELGGYYEQCTALLFPGFEDFGLTILEAQSFGKPVIAFRRGGALETIREGETGLFFNRQTAHSLEEVLKMFDAKAFNPVMVKKQAEKFSTASFANSFRKLINTVV